MRDRLIVKMLVATLSMVSIIMILFGFTLISYLGADGRRNAEREATEKLASMNSSLQVVNSLSLDGIHAALNVLRGEAERLGAPEVRGTVNFAGHALPDLRLGNTSQVNNFVLVDRIKELTSNTATLFVRSGEDFVRVSTNVKKADGSRAIGTALDRQGAAYSAIRAGHAFYGVVDVLGNPYMTGYEPMRNRAGEIVGIWYSGSPLTSLGELGKEISSTPVMDHGFLALLKPDGTVVFRPQNVTDDEARALASNQRSASWFVSSRRFDAWGYTLLAAYPTSDVAGRLWKTKAIVGVSTLVLMLLLTLSQYPLMTRLVLKPVEEMVVKMKNADINSSLDLSRTDEIGQLAAEFDRFLETIRRTMLGVVDTSREIANASTNCLNVSQQISANSEETSAQATTVSQAAVQVDHNLQTVATSTQEMSTCIQDIAKNATEAAKVAAEASASAGEATRIMAKLGDSSNQIGMVIKVITSIAKKTDLLALNATVEAARAGEVGAGFAVVANEVKDLAKQTAMATEDISRKVEAIQSDTKNAAGAITGITGVIDRVNNISGSIASAVEEQSAMANEMTRSIAEAAKGAESVTDNIKGVAEAAHNTSQGATDSRKAAQHLADVSQNLRQLVARFHLDEKDKRTFHQAQSVDAREAEPEFAGAGGRSR